MQISPIPAVLGVVFYLRDNPMMKPRSSISCGKSKRYLFKRFPKIGPGTAIVDG
jgi:hypothetical protein